MHYALSQFISIAIILYIIYFYSSPSQTLRQCEHGPQNNLKDTQGLRTTTNIKYTILSIVKYYDGTKIEELKNLKECNMLNGEMNCIVCQYVM